MIRISSGFSGTVYVFLVSVSLVVEKEQLSGMTIASTLGLISVVITIISGGRILAEGRLKKYTSMYDTLETSFLVKNSSTEPLSRCQTKNLVTWSGSLTSTESVGPMCPSLNTPSPAPQSKLIGEASHGGMLGSIPLYVTGDTVAPTS